MNLFIFTSVGLASISVIQPKNLHLPAAVYGITGGLSVVGGRRYEKLICITEGKQSDITAGFVQNIMQCDSAIKTNTKVGKESEKMRITSVCFRDNDHRHELDFYLHF